MVRRTGKRVISFILMLTLVITLFPNTSTAYAAEDLLEYGTQESVQEELDELFLTGEKIDKEGTGDESPDGAVPGSVDEKFTDFDEELMDDGSSGTITHDEITFPEWESTDSLPSNPGSYYLSNDVTISETWNLGAGMQSNVTYNLDLNGHDITKAANSEAGSVILVPSNTTFKLYDSSTDSDGMITGGNAERGGGVTVDGYFNMYGGKISGNVVSTEQGESLGGGVFYSRFGQCVFFQDVWRSNRK